MPNMSIVPLHEMENNQEADVFALLAEKELLKTKEGKPYIRVLFRDAHRDIRFPIWSDTGIYKEFKTLKPGTYCKLRAVYRVTTFGPQLDIRRIRPVVEEDAVDGFDPFLLRAKAPFPLDGLFEELQVLAAKQLGKGNKLLSLVTMILKEHRTVLLGAVASRHHHHSYVGGLLEHTLSVTKIAVGLVDHYHGMYPDRKKEISRSLVVAGAILHDLGKLLEYEPGIGSQRHSTEGELVGHAVLGRDLVRDAALKIELEPELRVRLEHIVLSHQRMPEWGAAQRPMSMEAMIVHHADSCDAVLGTFRELCLQDGGEHEMTSKKNVFNTPILKPPGLRNEKRPE